jgi:hypothetical protein
MYVRGDAVKLDPKAQSVTLDPDQWEVSAELFGVVHHVPTGNRYWVGLSDDAPEGETVSMFELCARLFWVEEGQVIPSKESQITFCRAAIAQLLVKKGLWEPLITDAGPKKPEDQRQKRKARGLDR